MAEKPLNERITIDVADRELTVAMARIRNRIDTEIRVQNWQNLSDKKLREWRLCPLQVRWWRRTVHQSRRGPLTFDLADDDFPTVLDIVKEEVLPPLDTPILLTQVTTLGSTSTSSTPNDRGYVHLTMAKGKGLIIQVDTGCRPWNRDEADTGE